MKGIINKIIAFLGIAFFIFLFWQIVIPNYASMVTAVQPEFSWMPLVFLILFSILILYIGFKV